MQDLLRTTAGLQRFSRTLCTVLLSGATLFGGNSQAMTLAEIDALTPQYHFHAEKATCNDWASTCTFTEGGTLQGSLSGGMLTMSNSEDLSKVKWGSITLVLDGALPNPDKHLQLPIVEPIWNGTPPPGGSGHGSVYINDPEFHSSPNTFRFRFSINPQPASETIDLNHIVLTNFDTNAWSLASNWSHVLSVDVTTVCVPEPGTAALSAASLLLLASLRRRKGG